jgi:hypothetical protein
MSNELTTATQQSSSIGFSSASGFELMQRVAKAFEGSDLVPDSFKGKLGNCIIGIELANRIGASPLMVMQNLNVIHGRPAWSSKFVISAINSCGKFSPLRFRITNLGKKEVEYSYTAKDWSNKDASGRPKVERKTMKVTVNDYSCVAYATELATGEILEGPPVSIEMAVQEGWYSKDGSKWKTMPDLMLRYRSASFFGSLYAPEILMGMQTVDEVADIIDVTPTFVETRPISPESIQEQSASVADINAKIQESKKKRQPKTTQTEPKEQPVATVENVTSELAENPVAGDDDDLWEDDDAEKVSDDSRND